MGNYFHNLQDLLKYPVHSQQIVNMSATEYLQIIEMPNALISSRRSKPRTAGSGMSVVRPR